MSFLGIGKPNEYQKQKRDIRLKKKEAKAGAKGVSVLEAENERLKIESGLQETQSIVDASTGASGKGSNTIWFVLGGVALLGGVVYFAMRKKK